MNRATHVASILILGACPGPRTPSVPAASPLTIAVGRESGSLRGVAGDGTLTFAAITIVQTGATMGPPLPGGAAPATPPSSAPPAQAVTVIEARRGDATAWTQAVSGGGGPIAAAAGLLVATFTGSGRVGLRDQTELKATDSAVRGEPGAALVAFDAAAGTLRWRITLDASEWCVVSAMASAPDGVVVGGSFAGSLRIHDRVVASGGRSDGFVAKLTANGDVAWLIRVGGGGPDAVQGVAVRGPRIAIAGTFASNADLLGHELPAFDDKSPYADAFVAVLDASGARTWSATFGGKLAETVAGVAIDETGRVAVAANARDTVHVGGADAVANGPADGLVAWWTNDGTASHSLLLGGSDFDGLRAITAVGERFIVGGFFSGTMTLGTRTLEAGGGDDAFLAALDAKGSVVDAWEVSGAGREEITALAAVPGGFLAGVAHTAAATVGGAGLASPTDPLSGAALIVRPVR